MTMNVGDHAVQTIDGHHRERACDELGIYCPREVRVCFSEFEKLALAVRSNCLRRHLSRDQKRDLIKAYLKRDPEIADNHLGQIIGVSKNTVAAIRVTMEATCQIDKFDTRRGKDGKERPTRYKEIITNTAKETQTATEVIADLPDNCVGKILDITSAKRRAARKRNGEEREAKRHTVSERSEDAIQIYHCPFQRLETMASVEIGSVDLIATDIPYDGSFVAQVEALTECAERLLKQCGILAL